MGIPLIARKGETEEAALKRWLSYSFITVTAFLMCLNVSGAWIGSHGNIFYTGAIAGAELFVALALGALMFTRNWLRFGVGIAIFAVGVWITLENGKMAVTESFNDVFTGTPVELRERADLADKRAVELDGDASETKSNDRTSLAALREEMAGLKIERDEMLSQTPEGIRRAQTRLKADGVYTGPIDGIREELTEAAMELRGEKLQTRMQLVQGQIDALTGVGAPPVVVPAADAVTSPEAVPLTPAEAKRAEAIELRKQAVEVEERTVWMNVLLVGLESIRSLALWVFLMDGVITVSRLLKRADDQLALAQANVRIAEVNAQIAALQNPAPIAVATSPVAPIAEPAPVAEPEPLTLDEPAPPVSEPPVVELTPAQRRGRAGGKAAAQYRAADKAKSERLILVGDWEARDADLLAAQVAAE